ncbi:MAG TPA: PINc/VapC family ATPase [Candidatus Acidoferrales bacterium]|nr:PINc/VapC family ATPase [Candidatus Acidoferrales bacterium]
MKYVPDTSVIIDGRITKLIEQGELKAATIIIPEAAISELEAQANHGREIGFRGLNELKALDEKRRAGEISLIYAGKRPTLEQVRLAGAGEIDAMIRTIAIDNDATFITSDVVQSEVARAKGIDVMYLRPEKEEVTPLLLDEFFTPDTMSVHLKENVPPMAKRGSIEAPHLVKIRDTPMSEKEMRDIATEIIERAKSRMDGFIELERRGATVVQLGPLRVAIARPPFSDGIEITVVRPIATVRLDEYRFAEELKSRLVGPSKGIIIAGPPGSGKSTLAQGVAEFLLSCDYIVKTMESPRDLQVPDEITQYTALEGDMAKTSDILLLVRPDYTIYDEVRKTHDFEIFADMRLAGVGMVGVVHTSRAIDAIQRLIGRVDFGVIPQIVDTVIFIKKGEIETVYNVNFVVKVPAGMTEADLARPVIEVVNFETEKLEYEIYLFSGQIVVMPVRKAEKPETKRVWKFAAKEIEREVGKYAKDVLRVEMLSDNRAKVYVSDKDISHVIGKGGKTIERIEEVLGIDIDVEPTTEKPRKGYEVETSKLTASQAEVEFSDKHVVITSNASAGDIVDVLIDDEYLFTATMGRGGEIKVTKGTNIANRIINAIDLGERIMIRKT